MIVWGFIADEIGKEEMSRLSVLGQLELGALVFQKMARENELPIERSVGAVSVFF